MTKTYRQRMPLPSILEIFVVWHPHDEDLGQFVSNALLDHFHSPTFSGLAGGAVEVYIRSEGWNRPDGPPRSIEFTELRSYELPSAQFTAVVPILSADMNEAFLNDPDWQSYLKSIFSSASCGGIGVFPLHDPESNLRNSGLLNAAGHLQALHHASAVDAEILCRDISQAIAQKMRESLQGSSQPSTPMQAGSARIKVFISHTKHRSLEGRSQGPQLFDRVRHVILTTHLDAFFDASDLQPGDDWKKELEAEAGRCALLMVRTDRYASREWTQREVLIAKEHDLPVVVLYALQDGEERGSFLMDHVPTVACRVKKPEEDIMRALNRLVDEALKSELWRFQSVYIREGGFDWLPVHSPEPVTAAPWLREHKKYQPDKKDIWIIHPDPPLGGSEYEVLENMCKLAGFSGNIEIFTPRTFADRGGEMPA